MKAPPKRTRTTTKAAVTPDTAPPGRPRLIHRLRQWDHKLKSFVAGIEQLGITHVAIAMLGLYTLVQIWSDISVRAEEAEDRRHAKIERAWGHLFSRMGGDTGKGRSLSALIAEKESVKRVNLSCQNIGDWDPSKGCIEKPIFVDIRWQEHGLDEWNVNIPNFKETSIRDSEMRRFVLSDEYFESTDIQSSDLREANVGGDMVDVTIADADLSNARIDMTALVQISASNLSGTTFEWVDPVSVIEKPGVEGIDRWVSENGWHGNWFWADRPPSFDVPKMRMNRSNPLFFIDLLYKTGVIICDPTYRKAPAKRWFGLFGAPVDEAHESRPRVSVDLSDEYQICPTINAIDAAKRFPEAYAHKKLLLE